MEHRARGHGASPRRRGSLAGEGVPSGPEGAALARLLAESSGELARLAAVRGASHRTCRRRAKAAAVLLVAAGLLRLGTRPAEAAAPSLIGPPAFNPFDLVNVGSTSRRALGDVDGDGDLDALVGGFDGATIFFENTGTASAPAFAAPQTNPFGLAGVSSRSSPALADLDGDGDLDALVGRGSGETFFFENTGAASAPAFSAPPTSPFGLANVASHATPELADVDGDGDLDALVGEFLGRTIFFENTGTATAPAFAAPQTNPFGLADVGAFSSPALADLDGDGDLDALVGEWYGNLILFENTGTAAAPAFAAPQTNPFGLADVGSFSNPALADLDGDGDLDAFVGEYDGATIFFENTGTATAPAFAAPQTNPFGLADVSALLRGRSSPALADVDCDGDLDALVGRSDGATIFFVNTGTATAPAFAAPQTNPFGLLDVSGGSSSPALADLDGDGDLDALIGDVFGENFFFENAPFSCAGAPRSGCDVPLRSFLLLKDSDDDARDAVQFRFIRGTTLREGSELGDPLSTHAYALCIYDHGALAAQMVASTTAGRWRALGKGRGFRYRDVRAASDGTREVLLKVGPSGAPKEPRVMWVGKGAGLPDPAVPVSEPVDVTVQVVGSNGVCFGDTFTTALKNQSNAKGTARIFKARRP